MELTIKRCGKKYVISGNSNIFGVRNRTAGLLLRKLKVFSDNSVIYTMAQRGVVRKFLINLLYLFFRPQMIPSYLIYKENEIVGKSKLDLLKGGHVRLYIDNIVYDLNLRAGNYMTILIGSNQVALVKKADVSYANQDEYSVLCEADLGKNLPLLLLLVMCLDVAFWSERVRWDALRWKKQ